MWHTFKYKIVKNDTSAYAAVSTCSREHPLQILPLLFLAPFVFPPCFLLPSAALVSLCCPMRPLLLSSCDCFSPRGRFFFDFRESPPVCVIGDLSVASLGVPWRGVCPLSLSRALLGFVVFRRCAGCLAPRSLPSSQLHHRLEGARTVECTSGWPSSR